jgi:hypothetical protein
MHHHPNLLEGISPELRRRKAGASLFAFKQLDDVMEAELQDLVARPFERHIADGD